MDLNDIIDEAEEIIDAIPEEDVRDEYGQDRLEQERNVIHWLRLAVDEGLVESVVSFKRAIVDVYGKIAEEQRK